ncbi:HD domain-containing protein [Pandoraea terrigena]|uniref:Bifunctional (P)ppGpp synthase/hydrolase RelA n=1 Tax=Pandoraea terrigena TaxID=2508292 RepID=A0A5E4W782_9BURK|nr:HD domain-containing protein [Pandoraea terrigena]VVE19953.1 Bifunctional (p)ppGpp synthase/hydrolase RelA [Pandoraea terrigena]
MRNLIAAIAFAAEKHRNQRRKDPDASPYINHPIALIDVLANEAYVEDETVLVAAILHDILEDTDTSAEELANCFGQIVADIVCEVSDNKTLSKNERKQLQIEHASNSSRPAKLIKIADKICNLRDLANTPPVGWSEERTQAYFDWAKAVVDQLRGVHPTLERLFDNACRGRRGEPHRWDQRDAG